MSKFFKGNVISYATDIDQYLSFHVHEEAFRNKYWNIQRHDIVMDIGVDYGPYTLTALSMGAEHVYAIEPDEEALEKLITNLKLNPEFRTRITIIPKYASDISDGMKERKVDDIVDLYNIRELDWLKIDVEGMEYKVLRGAENTLIHFRPKIIVENHSKENEIVCKQYLTRLGYELIFRNKELFPNLVNYNSQSVYHHFWE